MNAPAVTAPVATTTATRSRFVALDLMRFLAVLLMVQGHTFYAVLEPGVKHARWYMYHGYVHGFTAPLFFFSSGLAFGITTFRGWKHHLAWGRPILKRLERYGILFTLGYAMHAATFSLRGMLAMSREELMPSLEVDTLQNIALMLFVAEMLVVTLRKPGRFVAVYAALGLALVVAAPWLWRMDVSEVPLFFAAYVNESTTSIFPIAPWGGFTVAGVCTAYFLYQPETRSVRPRPYVPLALGGIGMILLADRLAHLGYEPWGEHNFWKTSPYFFLLRVGVVWCVLAVLSFAEAKTAWLRESRAAKVIQTIGSETLVIYVGHLFVLYGTPWTRSLERAYPETLTLPQSTLAFFVLMTAMVLLGWFWHRAKTTHPRAFDRVRWSVSAALALAFLLGPAH